ncbi:MAG TPA: MerR family DNA-binding protein [Pseudonocardiaceae bacterium]|jgi:DNA-binding transcriptional MerR regulator|nr:MerR family DNA-binding protein [Pseudonocardiaceae bacterium]
MPSDQLTITRLATRVGVRADTVRYYERIGLLPPAARTSGAHRRYDESVVDRMLFIKGVQRLGLPLAEIRELLAVRDTGVCACAPAESLLRQHLDEVDAELRKLAQLRTELAGMLAGITGTNCTDPEPGTWCPPAETRKEASRMNIECDCCTECGTCDCC